MMINRIKKTLLILSFFITLGVIFFYYFLGYGIIGYKTANEDCEKTENERKKYASDYIKKATFDSTVVFNMSNFQKFATFIFENEEMIKIYQSDIGKNRNRPSCSEDINYFPESIRNNARKLWDKCNVKNLTINIYGYGTNLNPKSIVFRINGCGKKIYSSTIYHDILVYNGNSKVEQNNEFNKILKCGKNTIYEIHIEFDNIDCEN